MGFARTAQNKSVTFSVMPNCFLFFMSEVGREERSKL